MNCSTALSSYQSEWGKYFIQEKYCLERLLPKRLIFSIQHIGSTSVPQLVAKPIIDILVEVHDLSELDNYQVTLEANGYLEANRDLETNKDLETSGEGLNDSLAVQEKHYFKHKAHLTHHIHVYEKGSCDAFRHIAFRDYLRSFEDVRQEYQAVKVLSSEISEGNPNTYRSLKRSFIIENESKAVAWKKATLLLAKNLAKPMFVSDDIALSPLSRLHSNELLEAVDSSRESLAQTMPWEKQVTDLSGAEIYISDRIESGLVGAHWYAIHFSDRFAGVFGIKSIDPETGVAEVGYWLAYFARGHRVIDQILNSICPYLRSYTNANTVEFHCLEDNTSSINIAKRLQATVVRRYPNQLGIPQQKGTMCVLQVNL